MTALAIFEAAFVDPAEGFKRDTRPGFGTRRSPIDRGCLHARDQGVEIDFRIGDVEVDAEG